MATVARSRKIASPCLDDLSQDEDEPYCDDPSLPFVDTRVGSEFQRPSWHSRVYAGGGGSEVPRKQPKASVKRAILDEQHNCCLYCGNEFGTLVMRGDRFTQLKIHWDHYVPYAYQANNHGFVASCNVCNLIKSSHVFPTLNEARKAILERWKDKGYEVIKLEGDI